MVRRRASDGRSLCAWTVPQKKTPDDSQTDSEIGLPLGEHGRERAKSYGVSAAGADLEHRAYRRSCESTARTKWRPGLVRSRVGAGHGSALSTSWHAGPC